jgi:hypothetical protein
MHCNEVAAIEDAAQDGKVVIECPGATLYDVETGRVLGGVKWLDATDFTKGFEIIGDAVFAPNHTPRRLIDASQAGKIARCQACQDYTVRMRAMQRTHPSNGPSPARKKAENLFRK